MPVSILGNSGIQFPDNSLQTAAASPFGLKNRIINGDMRIDQRNAGASVTVSNATITYITDRWNIYEDTSGAISAQQSTTAPAGFTNSFLTTVTSAGTATSGQLCRLQQRIEGFNAADLGFGTANAQSITISFWARSSLTGTYCVNVRNSAVDRSYVATYTISSANTFEYKTITIAGDTTGTWLTNNGAGLIISWDLGSGSSANTTAGSWVAGNKENTSAQANWIGTSGATFYITGVQLEIGTSATPFERRMYGQELALCQRYYVKYAFPVNTGVGASTLGTAVSTTLADGYIIPSVPFRVSASSLSLTVSSLQVYTVSSGSTFSSGTWAIPYDTNVLFVPIRYTHGSAVFTLGASQLIVGNGTTGFLSLSAEL